MNDLNFFWERQSRHVLLNKLGTQGAIKIRQASVLVIGLGGLGIPITSYLASGGVGRLGLVDGDQIEVSNLSRQFFYSEENLGKKKVAIAKEKVRIINTEVIIESYEDYFGEPELTEVMANYDVIVDAVDRLETKWMIHDLCLAHKKPLVHGSALGWQGQVLTVLANNPQTSKTSKGSNQKPSCLRCFFPNPDTSEKLTCSEAGVFSPLCGVIGSLQVAEVFKYLAPSTEPNYFQELLQVDLLRGTFRTIPPIENYCKNHT